MLKNFVLWTTDKLKFCLKKHQPNQWNFFNSEPFLFYLLLYVTRQQNLKFSKWCRKAYKWRGTGYTHATDILRRPFINETEEREDYLHLFT